MARKRYLKHQVNPQKTKELKGDNRVLTAVAPGLPRKKSPLLKAFTGSLDDLDDFFLKITNVFALNNAHFCADLDKMDYTAGRLEEQAAKWYKNIQLLVNEEVALQEGRSFDWKCACLTSRHFQMALKDSF